MPYPAIVVRYVGESWHTCAHSTQRYFSIDSGDTNLRINESSIAEEGNITIHNNEDYEPFFIIHNGKNELSKAELMVTITSKSGKEINSIPMNLNWKSFQTRVFNLSDLIDFRSFLGNQIGTFKVKFLISGVFSRIIAGQRLKNDGQWSIDHTNFAASDGAVLKDVFQTSSDPSFKNLVFNVPNSSNSSWECYADIYPTYPENRYTVKVNSSNSNSKEVESTTLLLEKGSKNAMQRINCCSTTNNEIIFNHQNFLPRRFHIGVQYKINNGHYGFLTDGPLPHDSYGNSTRWMPLFDTSSCENFFLIANRAMGDQKSKKNSFTVNLFNSFGDSPLVSSFDILENESKTHNVCELFKDYDSYLKGESGWIYLTSKSPQHCVLHYVSVKSGNSIACDHAF